MPISWPEKIGSQGKRNTKRKRNRESQRESRDKNHIPYTKSKMLVAGNACVLVQAYKPDPRVNHNTSMVLEKKQARPPGFGLLQQVLVGRVVTSCSRLAVDARWAVGLADMFSINR